MCDETRQRACSLIIVTCFAWILGGAIERVGAQSLAAQGAFRTVALTGQQAPDAPTGVIFERFGAPLIGAGGQVAFRALVSGIAGSESNFGLWSETVTSELRAAALFADQAPGLEEGTVYSGFSGLGVDEVGNVSYGASVRPEGSTRATATNVFYSEVGSNGPRVLARKGDPAPGTSEDFDKSFSRSQPLLSSTGFAAFVSPFDTTISIASDVGIWSDRNGEVELLARTGDSFPGLPTGTTMVLRSERNPFAVNPKGDVAFVGAVRPDGGPFFDAAIIVEDRPVGFRAVAIAGEQAPGLAGGILFGDFTPVTTHVLPVALGFNEQGETAFFSKLTGNDVSTANDLSIWSEVGGQLHLVAREGDQIPGFDDGRVFDRIGNRIALSGNGTVVFGASFKVEGTPIWGIWAESPEDGFRPIMIPGDDAPGTEPLITFDDTTAGNPGAVDANGRFYFSWRLSGPNIDEGNNSGLWSGLGRDDLTLVARRGDTLEVAPDDWRTIANFAFGAISGSEDGRPIGYNDLNQAALFVGFTDGTEGIIVVTVPEPASWKIFVILGMGIFVVFRRHLIVSRHHQ